jgi:hypothetical protein
MIVREEVREEVRSISQVDLNVGEIIGNRSMDMIVCKSKPGKLTFIFSECCNRRTNRTCMAKSKAVARVGNVTEPMDQV